MSPDAWNRLVEDLGHVGWGISRGGGTELFRCLEHWRRVALLQRDPARFASIVRRAAERLTGEPVPADKPLALTRRHVSL